MISHILLNALVYRAGDSVHETPFALTKTPAWIPLFYAINDLRHALAPRVMQYFRVQENIVKKDLLTVPTSFLSRHINMAEEWSRETSNLNLIALAKTMPNLQTICLLVSNESIGETVKRLIEHAPHVRKIALDNRRYENQVLSFDTYKNLLENHPSEDVRILTIASLIITMKDDYGDRLKEVLIPNMDYFFQYLFDRYLSEGAIAQCASDAKQIARVAVALEFLSSEQHTSRRRYTAGREGWMEKMFPVLLHALSLESNFCIEYGCALLHAQVFAYLEEFLTYQVNDTPKYRREVLNLLPRVIEIIKRAFPVLSNLVHSGKVKTPCGRLYHVNPWTISDSSETFELLEPDSIRQILMCNAISLIKAMCEVDAAENGDGTPPRDISDDDGENAAGGEEQTEVKSVPTSRGRSLKNEVKAHFRLDRPKFDKPISPLLTKLLNEYRLFQFIASHVNTRHFANTCAFHSHRVEDGIRLMIDFLGSILHKELQNPGMSGINAAWLRAEKDFIRTVFECCACFGDGISISMLFALHLGEGKRITIDSHMVPIKNDQGEEIGQESLIKFLLDTNFLYTQLNLARLWNGSGIEENHCDMLRNVMAAWPVVWKRERRAIAEKSDNDVDEVVLKHHNNVVVKVKMGPYRLLEKVLNIDTPLRVVEDLWCMKRIIRKDAIVRAVLEKELSAVEDLEKAALKVYASDACGNLDFKKDIALLEAKAKRNEEGGSDADS
jgi:uncharacterized protein YeeX (DUF496 family)